MSVAPPNLSAAAIGVPKTVVAVACMATQGRPSFATLPLRTARRTWPTVRGTALVAGGRACARPHTILQAERRFHGALTSEQKIVDGQDSAEHKNSVSAGAYQRIPI